MNENSIFNENTAKTEQKPLHVASLVLGILAIVFSWIIPLVGEILGIIGIVQAVRKRFWYASTAGLVCSIIGLVLAVVMHILNYVILYMQLI